MPQQMQLPPGPAATEPSRTAAAPCELQGRFTSGRRREAYRERVLRAVSAAAALERRVHWLRTMLRWCGISLVDQGARCVQPCRE